MKGVNKDVVLQLRSPSGTKRVTVPSSATHAELLAAISNACGIAVHELEIKVGFPPSALSADVAVDKLGGQLLTVSQQQQVQQVQQVQQPAARGLQTVRRVVAADNSCLFTSFAYIFEGKTRAIDNARALRRVVADAIRTRPDEYSEPFLGKPPAEYCGWIVLDGAWGGAIEVAILAEHFGAEARVVDVQTGMVLRYGEDDARRTRVCFLLFDGIHYDPFALNVNANGAEANDVTFLLRDRGDEVQAAQAGAEGVARELRQKLQFTDTSKFQLRCMVCGNGLKGEEDAVKHAQQTKHTNFQEFQ